MATITNGNKGGLLQGTPHDDTIDGAGGDDLIGGLLGDDTIDGGTGDDHINGGAGHDILTGGKGSDVFVFKVFTSDDSDTITDFKVGTELEPGDFIGIDGYYLTAFSNGQFTDDEFTTGKHAHDANDYLIYNNHTGKLFYDADGKGGEQQHLLATFEHKPHLDANSFHVFVEM